MFLWILLATLSLSQTEVIVRDNVLFQKLDQTAAAKSSWSIAFAIELDPFADLLSSISARLAKIEEHIYTLWNANRFHGSPSLEDDINKVLSMVSAELENLKKTTNYLAKDFEETQTLSRQKRSLIPIVGKALSWLFGTVSDEDLQGIRSNINHLYTNQVRMSHVVEKGLSVMKLLQSDIKENVEKINQIISAVDTINHQFQNVSSTVNEVKSNLHIYIQLDRVIYRVFSALGIARDYNTQIKLQLNMITLGHLSPIVISPSDLKTVLLDLKGQLDKDSMFELPYDPVTEIWTYYKTLSCIAYIEARKIVVITAIPLTDRSDKFHLYKVINLAVPRQKFNQTNMVAKYDLEGTALIIDDKREKFSILSTSETEECTKSPGFCSFNGPIYSVMSSNLCIVNLFMENKVAVRQYCNSRVYLKPNLPTAEYVSDGSWFIVTNSPLKFTVICKNLQNSVVRTTLVSKQVEVVTLPTSCSAHSGKLTLPAHFHKETTADWNNPLQQLIDNYELGTGCWDKLDLQLQNVKQIEIPTKLSIHRELPIQALIDEVSMVKPLDTMSTPRQIWPYVISLLAVLVCIAVVLYTCRHRLARLCRIRLMHARPVERRGGGVRFLPSKAIRQTTLLNGGDNTQRARDSTTLATLGDDRKCGPGVPSRPAGTEGRRRDDEIPASVTGDLDCTTRADAKSQTKQGKGELYPEAPSGRGRLIYPSILKELETMST